MATATRVGEPARVGRWGVTVDSMAAPTTLVVISYPKDGVRHSEPFDVVARVPWRPPSRDVRAILAAHGVPSGVATQLDVQITEKLLSPKSADADQGFRPVR